jgi:cytochrome b involved in lipid metabolism
MLEYTLEQVQENNYIIIDNNVYNFLDFETKHPGKAGPLIRYRGKDATEKFHRIKKHNKKVKEELKLFLIGILVNQ